MVRSLVEFGRYTVLTEEETRQRKRDRYRTNRGLFHRRHTMPYLQELRLMRGYSRQMLSRLSGVGHSTITRAENGDGGCQVRTVLKLSKALQVRPEQLLGDGEPYPA